MLHFSADFVFVLHIWKIHFDVITNNWSKYLTHFSACDTSLCPTHMKNHGLFYDNFTCVFRMMATNYIGAFCLTKLLLPLLRNSPVPSRIVNVTSFTHRNGKIGSYLCLWNIFFLLTISGDFSLHHNFLFFDRTITFFIRKNLYTCNCCPCTVCSTSILCQCHSFDISSEISIHVWYILSVNMVVIVRTKRRSKEKIERRLVKEC